jgi:hypothetical protein
MPIKSLTLQDVGPFAGKHEFSLPAVCLIQGGNGVGKTGLQDCIKYVGDRGHDPDMIHGNAEFGEIVITMADDHQMKARITRGETARAWKPKDAKRWIVNRAYIDEVCNALAFDPLRFLEKEPGEQLAEFLKLVALPPCPEEIGEAIGMTTPVDIANLPALQAIDAVYDTIYAERTRLNTSADSLEKHVAELRRALPAEAEGGWPAKAADLRMQKQTAEMAQRVAIGAINEGFQGFKRCAEESRAAAYEVANAAYAKAMREVEDARAAAKEAADAACASAIEEARQEAQATADRSRESSTPEIDRLTSELANAELLAQQEEQAKGTRAAIDRAATEAADKRASWEKHNTAVENLRKLRTSLAERLPIKGVTVRDGRIVREQYGGMVPLKKWNTADQRKLALRIGMLVGAKAGFVVVDHVESFDRAQRAALIATCNKYAEEQGIQFILASVSPYDKEPEALTVIDGSVKRGKL